MPVLNTQHLNTLPPTVAPLGYDRNALQTGIVHLGLGAFHRAHQALYTQSVLQAGDARWGIAGVSLRSEQVPQTLNDQDRLYTVFERHGAQGQAQLVGALTHAWHAPSQRAQVLAALANPAVKVVTLTVTEKAYGLHPATGAIDEAHPQVRHDLTHAHEPQGVLGYLCEALRLRDPAAPLTLVCCDNMANNGDVLHRLLGDFTQRLDPQRWARWSDHLQCPNTMVDRIVPAATESSLAWAQSQLGVRDAAAVVCEPFTQWVIEDRFAAERPEWERAGALLVPAVGPFQAMKLRLLNGSHSAIAYLGQLLGVDTVAQVMASPPLAAFVRELMTQDLLSVTAVPAGYDAQRYCDDLLHRFENESLAHRTEQIAMDGTQKVAVRWLPALRDALARQQALPRLEWALAAWLHYLKHPVNAQGQALAVQDPGAAALQALLADAQTPAEALAAALTHAPVFGSAPWPTEWQQRVAAHGERLQTQGVLASLAALGAS